MAERRDPLTSASTRTATDDRDPEARPPERESCLVVQLECARPAAGSARHVLSGVDEVRLGRGSERMARRSARTLTITIPDQRISTHHAYLVREFGRWAVEDLGSKNGTRVDGHRRPRTVLEDGARIEIGQTLLLYRESDLAGLPADSESSDMDRLAPDLVTFVPALHRTFSDLARVSRADTPILILGESGTGKERVARSIHALAARAGAFVAVNCGALPATLVESELFGFCRGAFSGAESDRLGFVRSADRGTLFLDELSDLPPPAQAALLRVLQEREVTPLGTSRPVPVDIALCSATHASLDALAGSGELRQDLFARLAGFVVELPPLRDRREDIGIIVAELLARIAGDSADRLVFDAAVARLLLEHPWPLNVRELEQTLKVAVALAGDRAIELEHLPGPVRARAAASAHTAALDDEQLSLRDELLDLLRRHRGNVSQVARSLGKPRPLVYRWLKRFGIDPRDSR